ncbi:MAG: hypothetical protein NTNFB02_01500 [Nitrospira sp.]
MQKQARPYAYEIPSLDPLPSVEELRAVVNRRGWEPIEEFLRVEALLRSEKARELYEASGRNPRQFGRTFATAFGVRTEDPLNAEHHAGLFLDEAEPNDFQSRWLAGGAINVTQQVAHPNQKVRESLVRSFAQRLLGANGRYIVVEFDTERPESPQLEAVKTLFTSKRKPLPASPFRNLNA